MAEELIKVKQPEWYQKLIFDLKKLAWTSIVETKHSIGKRIIEDELKFDKPKYGNKRIENLAKDLETSPRDLYCCIQFAKKCNTVAEFKDKSWRYIVANYLPKQEKDEAEIPHLPKGRYSVVYADPPWRYWAGGWKNAMQHYDCLEVDDIANIPIQEISAENCILFMWATFPALPEAFRIIEAWGFKYSTVGFVWVKSKKDGTGFAFGTGNWTRANAEICLIATKGTIERKDASISQIIYTPLEEHSKKPAIVRDKIIQLVGNLQKIELFARQKTEGWDFWGKEMEENGRRV